MGGDLAGILMALVAIAFPVLGIAAVVVVIILIRRLGGRDLAGEIPDRLDADRYRFDARTLGVDEVSGEVIDLLRQGRKIDAIKVYRAETGVGLKEAKDAVDAVEREL